VQSGRITAGEFNADLKNDKGVEQFDKMRREAVVASSLKLVTLPVLGCKWDIECDDDRAGDFLREALFQRIDWDAFLRHALLCFPFGFELMEKVWGRGDDGMLWIDSIEHRAQTSIRKWHVDDEVGGLAGVTQRIYRDGAYYDVELTDEHSAEAARIKLFHVALNQEGDNFAGLSGLRPAWPYWKAKYEAFTHAAIQVERYCVGVPSASPPVDPNTGTGKYTPDDKDAAIEILKNWKSGRQSWIWNPGGWDFGIKGQEEGSRFDPLPFLDYCDRMILVNVLGEFTRLGETASGSRAVAEQQVDVFMLAEEGLADLISSRVDAQLIRPLLELNFPNGADIDARIRWSDLTAESMDSVAQYVERLSRAEAITVDDELEAHLRDIGDLPQREGAPSQTATSRPRRRITAHEHTDACEHGQAVQAADSGAWWRELRDHEKVVAFSEIQGREDEAVDEVGAIVDQVRKVWADDLIRQVDEAVKDGSARAIADIAVPVKLRRSREQDIFDVVREAYAYGRQTVLDERRRAARRAATSRPLGAIALRDDELDDAETRDLLLTRVRRYLGIEANKTASVASEDALGLWRTKGVDIDEGDYDQLAEDLDDSLSGASRLAARVLISEALSMGRDKQATIQQDDLKYVYYSAILDGNVCDNCRELDSQGSEYVLGSPEYYADQPPNRQCLSVLSGANRCRCIYVYVWKTEQDARG